MNRSEAVTSHKHSIDQPLVTDSGYQAVMFPLAMRFVVYMLVILGVIQGLLAMASWEAYAVQFEEGRFVEWAQVGLMAVTTTLLATAVRITRRRDIFLTAMTLLASIALVRELDSILDRLIPYIGWQLLAGPIFGWAVWLIYRHFNQSCQQALAWAHSPAAGVVWSGMITVLVYAQVTGQADIWQSVMGDGYTRHFKRVIEESAEMFGYLLILFGAIETLIWVRANPQKAASESSED